MFSKIDNDLGNVLGGLIFFFFLKPLNLTVASSRGLEGKLSNQPQQVSSTAGKLKRVSGQMSGFCSSLRHKFLE